MSQHRQLGEDPSDGTFDAAAPDSPSIALVDSRGVITWVNTVWRAFGQRNGAAATAVGVGVGYFDAVTGPQRDWLVDKARSCLTRGQPFGASYECPSPTENRLCHLRIVPLAASELLFVHSLRATGEPVGPSLPGIDARYRQPGGAIEMCGGCRRVRSVDGATWDWVPSWVSTPPPGLRYGLCESCRELYFN